MFRGSSTFVAQLIKQKVAKAETDNKKTVVEKKANAKVEKKKSAVEKKTTTTQKGITKSEKTKVLRKKKVTKESSDEGDEHSDSSDQEDLVAKNTGGYSGRLTYSTQFMVTDEERSSINKNKSFKEWKSSKKRSTKDNPEDQLQSASTAWFDSYFGNNSLAEKWVMIRNCSLAGQGKVAKSGRAKRNGYTAGWLDWECPYTTTSNGCLHIEFKIHPNKPSPKQLDMIKWLRLCGHRAEVVWTFAQFKSIVQDHFKEDFENGNIDKLREAVEKGKLFGR